MPDIARCIGHECPLKEACYRYTAIPSEYMQSYFIEVPYTTDEDDPNVPQCDYFWSNGLNPYNKWKK